MEFLEDEVSGIEIACSYCDESRAVFDEAEIVPRTIELMLHSYRAHYDRIPKDPADIFVDLSGE